MTPVWIGHYLKLFFVLNQLINKLFGVGVMHVVVARTVNIKQVAAQIFGVSDGRSGHEVFAIFLGQAHVAFLVDVVVEQLIADGSNGNTGFINIGILKQQVQRG